MAPTKYPTLQEKAISDAIEDYEGDVVDEDDVTYWRTYIAKLDQLDKEGKVLGGS